jgi:predicted transcriptional regulator
MLVLKRDGWGGYTLHGKGRDLIEVEKAMSFDKEACIWRIEGEAVMVRRSSERQAVLDAITESKQPIGPGDIAAAAEMKPGNVRRLLGKLVTEGVIEKTKYGRYQRAGARPAAAPKETSQHEEAAEAPAVKPLASWEADDLRARGFSADEIFGMSPDYARAILADPTRNRLTERFGKGGDTPPDTLCRACKRPGARLFGEPTTAGVRQDRFPGFTPLHLECCPKFFESSLPMEAIGDEANEV